MDFKNMVIHIDLLSSVRSLIGFNYSKNLRVVREDGGEPFSRTDHEFSLGCLLLTVSLVIPEKRREVI